MGRWLSGIVLAVTLTLCPKAALAAPLTLQFAWDDSPTVFSLAVLQGSWPAGLEAFVVLDGTGLDVGGAPWCSQGGPRPDYAPVDASFAFCSSNLGEPGSFDQLGIVGTPTAARLYLGTIDSFFDVYTELRAPGEVLLDYPIPEPATLLIMGAGLIGLGATLRRRTRRPSDR